MTRYAKNLGDHDPWDRPVYIYASNACPTATVRQTFGRVDDDSKNEAGRKWTKNYRIFLIAAYFNRGVS